MSCRCFSVMSAAWCGSCSPAGVSRRNDAACSGSSLWCCSPPPARPARGSPQRRRQLLDPRRLRPQCRRRRVGVTTLVGPDSDAHVYSPTPGTRKNWHAKIVFINGLGFEGWLPRLVKSAGGKAVVTATAGIAPLKLGSAADPAPGNRSQTQNLCRRYPRCAGRRRSCLGRSLQVQCAAYLAELDALEREVREAIAKILGGRRKVISTHDAFGYFAVAYGVDFIAPLGVSTESEASAATSRNYHPGQGRPRFRPFFSKMSATPA